MTLFRQVGAKLGEANVLQAIGDVQQFRKENDAALESYHAALTLFRQVGAKLGEANVLLEMSRLELRRGEFEKANSTFKKLAPMRHLMRDVFSEGRDYYYFARTLIEVEKKKEAKSFALKAKDCFEQVGEKFLVEYAEKLIAACEE